MPIESISGSEIGESPPDQTDQAPPPVNSDTGAPLRLILNIEPPDWMAKAACSGLPKGMFFPEDDGEKSTRAKETIKNAKEICNGCAVAAGCLEYALVTNSEYGVWGGTSRRERKVITLQRRLATHK